MEPLQKIKDSNDDYLNTIFAIIGFMNTYKYELDKQNIDVKLFQGRKFDKTLITDNNQNNFVTPDIAILINNKLGVIGEVKNSFPKDESFWISDFQQLQNYDDVLIGWPTPNEKVESHDIVLLVEQSRLVKVRDFFIAKNEIGEIKFTKPFVIIEYFRTTQSKEYFNFRIGHGKLSNTVIQNQLYVGLPVPMSVFITLYSRIRFYDSQPELSWILFNIYHCTLEKLTGEGKFQKVGKNSKIKVPTSVSEITDLLIEHYSFHSIHKNHQDRQPHFPKKEWIKDGVNKLVLLGEANWTDDLKENFVFIFKQKPDAKDYYEKCCLTEQQDSLQIELDFN